MALRLKCSSRGGRRFSLEPSEGCWAGGRAYPDNYTARQRIRSDKTADICESLPRCPLRQKQALHGTPTTSTHHLIWADAAPVCSSQSSLQAVCLKVRASSQLQQLNIKLAAAVSPRAQLTQSIALHYSWRRPGPMRWPLTEGWIPTVANFTGAGVMRDTFNNCLSSAKMTTRGTQKVRLLERPALWRIV